MVNRDDILALVREAISGTEIFLVEASVKPGNIIRVFVDEPAGISLDECVRISKAIEDGIDREKEDFDLQVSSPGLENPLIVIQQYEKNIGNELKVITIDNQRITGELIEVDPAGINLKAMVRVKNEGSKKSKPALQNVRIKFGDIKSAKVSLHFKE